MRKTSRTKGVNKTSAIDFVMFPDLLELVVSFHPQPSLLAMEIPSDISPGRTRLVVGGTTPGNTHHAVLARDPSTDSVLPLAPVFTPYVPSSSTATSSSILKGASTPSPAATDPDLVPVAASIDVLRATGQTHAPLLARPHTLRLLRGAAGAALHAFPAAPHTLVLFREPAGNVRVPIRDGVVRAVLCFDAEEGGVVTSLDLDPPAAPKSLAEVVVHLGAKRKPKLFTKKTAAASALPALAAFAAHYPQLRLTVVGRAEEKDAAGKIALMRQELAELMRAAGGKGSVVVVGKAEYKAAAEAGVWALETDAALAVKEQ